MKENILKNEEKAVLSLRGLYKKYGYLPFKMSKFEEYELYLRNKDFLIGDGVITFNDTNGKLLALKPDVTLSIVKNAVDEAGCKQKFFYNENVYRISGSTHQYKELMQAGIECIGDIDLCDILEVITLAEKSLSLLSDSYILAISHPGVLNAIIESGSISDGARRRILSCFAEKNAHELETVCAEEGISPVIATLLSELIGLYGDAFEVYEKINSLCSDIAPDATELLGRLIALLEKGGCTQRLKLDMSLVSESDYYNGFVFKGFLEGICESVLTGGQYGKLLRRMGRRSDAIGFAIYLDRLESLSKSAPEYDVDVLLLYSDGQSPFDVAEMTARLVAEGKSVSAQKAIPSKLRYKEMINMKGDGTK